MRLRPYQQAAVDALYSYFETKDGNPVIVLPTGTGKSVVIAGFGQRACADFPSIKIIVATHSKELVSQNHHKFHVMCPYIDTGIFSAGIGKKQVGRQVTFAGIQSIFRHAQAFQHIDLLIVDEAQTIPKEAEGMWREFIDALLIINPDLKVIGFTATDYRVKGGKLTKGRGRIFTDIAYEENILDMIKQGYLTPLNNDTPTETIIDTSQVGKVAGEFNKRQLEQAANVDRITRAAIDETFKYGANRKAWLAFCAGSDHAFAVRDEIRSRGISCETVTHKTPKGERDQILQDFKDGKIRCVTNNNVLTVGFDAPNIDLIACLRPTYSPGLWVQMLGRGTRPVYANGYDLDTQDGRLSAIFHGSKPDCLVLDFTDNTARFGPIDKITVDYKEKEPGGDAPIKNCPECAAVNYASARLCRDCGYEFPPGELDIGEKASKEALLSNQIKSKEFVVNKVYYSLHQKPGKKASMRVDYLCGVKIISQWMHFDGYGNIRMDAVNWWRGRTGFPDLRAPNTVDEALERANGGELNDPQIIYARKVGKYMEITGAELK